MDGEGSYDSFGLTIDSGQEIRASAAENNLALQAYEVQRLGFDSLVSLHVLMPRSNDKCVAWLCGAFALLLNSFIKKLKRAFAMIGCLKCI